MQINELKKMLKKSTAVLIFENGEPSIVVVDYKNYKELLDIEDGQDTNKTPSQASPNADQQPQDVPAGKQEMELLERINKDILALKEQIEEEEKGLGL